MPVIAFACFVVVPQQTFAFDYKGAAVLVHLSRAWKRRRYFPDNNLRERVLGAGNAFSDKFGRFHGGNVFILNVVVNVDNECKFRGVQLKLETLAWGHQCKFRGRAGRA